MREIINALSKKSQKDIKEIFEKEIENLAVRLRKLRETIERAKEEIDGKSGIREKLKKLVLALNPDGVVKTEKVIVKIVPQPPKKRVGSKEFLELLESLTTDPFIKKAILRGCININVKEAEKLIRAHFGKRAAEKLEEIAESFSQEPHVLVEVLLERRKE